MVEFLLTADDDGNTIDTRIGDVIVIELAENPTTGFRWAELSDSTPVAELRADAFIPPTGEVIGAPGVRHLEYAVTQAGTVSLHLAYRQEWEPTTPGGETYSIEIVSRV